MDASQNMPETKPKHAGGRPPKWATPEELQKAVDAYFDDPHPVKTVMGLCIAMDCGRHTLFDYGRKDEFAHIVTRAKRRIMDFYEFYGQTGRNTNFADRMLTRMGWAAVEKQEIDAHVTSVADLMAALGTGDDDEA